MNLERSTDERDSLICSLELSSANSQEMFSYKSFLFCLLHTYIWSNLLALPVYDTNFILPVLTYSTYSRLHLWPPWSFCSPPTHLFPSSKNTRSLRFLSLSLSFFFSLFFFFSLSLSFPEKKISMQFTKLLFIFFQIPPAHILHSAYLHWANKQQNQHKWPCELSPLLTCKYWDKFSHLRTNVLLLRNHALTQESC